MTVAIVTPWHNHPELWPDYEEVVHDAHEIIVVDNNSDPPLPFATIRVQTNLGFCGGSNVGLRAATADIVVFLNNDVKLVNSDWLNKLTEQVEPGVLAGPRLRNDPHAWVDGKPIPYLDGWCIAGMRQDFLDLGGWDTWLVEPAYFSDNLLCLEARAAGMRLREVPVGLLHLGGVTSKPKNNPECLRATLANRDTYQARARELLEVAA